jgi:hypothetical protein
MNVTLILSAMSAAVTAVFAVGAGAQVPPTAVYEYVYPYNTPDLIENHFIVLDSSGGAVRGWYYGTSDEFDTAREGYLPGFFVAPISGLRLAGEAISFTLTRPARFFTTPVPLQYREGADVPRSLLEEWTIPLTTEAREYAGMLRGSEIELAVQGGPRTFRLAGAR